MSRESAGYVFTTLRFDAALRDCKLNTSANRGLSSAIYLLQAHYDRLVEAADGYLDVRGSQFLANAGISSTLQLDAFIRKVIDEATQPSSANSDCFRIRLQIDELDSSVKHAVTSVPRLSVQTLFPQSLDGDDCTTPAWKVTLDSQPTQQNDATRYKSDDRSDYNRARADAGISSFSAEHEVLLYDHNGWIMDGSITTPYFKQHGQWTTPHIVLGGQQGATRRWALQNQLCREGHVNKADLHEGMVIWLSNAARGFFRAVYQDSNAMGRMQ